MTRIPTRRPAGSRSTVAGSISADVVVVGGGPAATWAALAAAESGADVVLADKGYCGTSGPTASGGTGVWYVEPRPAAREAAMASREGLGGYQVRAGAVVLATGGCAFLSGALGTNVNTDDGALLAAEAGADLSGMEFSNAYAIAPAFTSVTKTAYYSFATFFHPDGTPLEGAGSQRGRSMIVRALSHGPANNEGANTGEQ